VASRRRRIQRLSPLWRQRSRSLGRLFRGNGRSLLPSVVCRGKTSRVHNARCSQIGAPSSQHCRLPSAVNGGTLRSRVKGDYHHPIVSEDLPSLKRPCCSVDLFDGHAGPNTIADFLCSRQTCLGGLQRCHRDEINHTVPGVAIFAAPMKTTRTDLPVYSRGKTMECPPPSNVAKCMVRRLSGRRIGLDEKQSATTLSWLLRYRRRRRIIARVRMTGR